MSHPERLNDLRLRALFAHWDRLRGNILASSYAEFAPFSKRHELLPNVLVAQVVLAEWDRRNRLRLCGAEIEWIHGGSMRVRHVDELATGFHRDYMPGLYRRLLHVEVPDLLGRFVPQSYGLEETA